MGKIIKKGQKGAALNYISRNKALKKLQVSLADFRRLCILKGIYPREPRNKKKLQKGSTVPMTYYYVKDLQHLQADPILATFREQKIVEKKIARALCRGERDNARRWKERVPQVSLAGIVRERYPTFVEAVADLDDALCMVYLFAQFPQTDRVQSSTVELCKRLCREFEHAVIKTRALRKVFLSIKGIYYQAEVAGHTVTWIAPYEFSLSVPSDVDFRVMLTFLEFYTTMLEFVLVRMYKEMNTVYPLVLNEDSENMAKGLASWIVEEQPLFEEEMPIIESKSKAIDCSFLEEISNKVEQGSVQVAKQSKEQSTESNDFKGEISINDLELNLLNQDKFKNLFSHQMFFLSREVQRTSMDFLIRSFGGKVGWEPWTKPNDPSITHVIIDRPMTDALLQSFNDNVVMIQPQYIADSINAQTLLPYDKYEPGMQLPCHLSPFEQPKDGDYVPEEAEVTLAPREPEMDERREMAIGMMSKRDKKLYDQIQHAKNKRSAQAEKLKAKKKALKEK